MFAFREYDRRLCIIEDAAMAKLLCDNKKAEANAILCCAYIDHEAGLSFRALAAVRIEANEYSVICDNDTAGFTIRADESLAHRIRPVSDTAVLRKYSAELKALELYYYGDFAKVREIKELDALRHPFYPDDINVVFIWEEREPEQMWVRCENYLGTDENGIRYFDGTLLNEPYRNFGFHAGKRVEFGLFTENGQSVCIGSGKCRD